MLGIDIIMVILSYWFNGYDRCEAGMLKTYDGQIQTEKMNQRRNNVENECLNFQLISKDFRDGFLEFTRIEIPKLYEYNAIACPKNVLQLYKTKLGLPIEKIRFNKNIFYFFKVFKGNYKFSSSFSRTFKCALSNKFTIFFRENELHTPEMENILRRPLQQEEIHFKDRLENCEVTKKINDKIFLNLEDIYESYPELKRVYVCGSCPIVTEITSGLNIVSCVDFYALESLFLRSCPIEVRRNCVKDHLCYNATCYYVIMSRE